MSKSRAMHDPPPSRKAASLACHSQHTRNRARRRQSRLCAYRAAHFDEFGIAQAHAGRPQIHRGSEGGSKEISAARTADNSLKASMYREKELTDAEFERDVSRWSDESNRCYIATTPPMRERACRKQLREQGMTVFLPECIDLSERVTARMRHGNRRLDRIKRRRTPIYPGYLFLRSTD